MTQDPETQFGELLAQYDEAIASATDDVCTVDATVYFPKNNDALQQRFERVRVCLELLEMDRRSISHSPDDAEGGQVLDDTIGTDRKIGRFNLVRRLGAGGFGVVFLANDPALRRQVAVKIPRPETLATPGLQERFIRESQIVAQLTHPHLVPIYEAGQAGPVSYQVTAYCAGGTLTSWLRSNSQNPTVKFDEASQQIDAPALEIDSRPLFPIAVAVEVLIGLSEGVQHAHDHGILHRDLKPSNILLHPKGERPGDKSNIIPGTVPLDSFCHVFQPMVSDFGLARLFDETQIPSSTPLIDEGHTPPMTLMAGTPQYMAPEQLEETRTRVGPATDVYGLGAILYELVTGKVAFPGGTANRLTSANGEPPSMRASRPDCPRDLDAICRKCLAIPIAERYASARALADDLRAFLRGDRVIARPWPWYEVLAKWSRRRPAVASLVGLSLFLMLGLIFFGGWHLSRLEELNTQLVAIASERELQTRLVRHQQLRADEHARLADEKGKLALLQSHRSDELAWIAREREYAASIIRAADRFDKHDLGQTSNVLQRFLRPPTADDDDVRGYEWRYLFQQSLNFRNLKGHTDTVCGAKLTPDGKTCFSISRDATIRRWDVELCRLVETWAIANATKISWARIDRDVTRAIILQEISEKGLNEVIAWDLVQGTELSRRSFVAEQGSPVDSFAISPDGKFAAIACGARGADSASIVLWDLQTSEISIDQVPQEATAAVIGINAIEISPDARQLAVAMHSAVVGQPWSHRLWRATLAPRSEDDAAPRQIADWQVVTPTAIGLEQNLVFSSDGRRLALSTKRPYRVEVWDWIDARLIDGYSMPDSEITAISLDDRGETVAISFTTQEPAKSATTSTAPQVRTLPKLTLWKLGDAAPRSGSFPAMQIVDTIRFHESTGNWVIGEHGGWLTLWHPDSIPPYRELIGHQPSEAWAVKFSPDGQTLYSAGDDECLRAWDLASGRELAVESQHSSLVACLEISPDGRWVATGSYDDNVVLWRTNPLKMQAILKGHTHDVRSVAFSPDSSTLISAGRDNTVRAWDVERGTSIGLYRGTGGVIRAVDFATNDEFVEGNSDGQIVRWDLKGAADRIRVESEAVHAITFAPIGLKCVRDLGKAVELTKSLINTAATNDVLLYGCKHGAFKLLHLPTNEVWWEGSHPVSDINSVAFSPDGRTLAIATEDHAVHLWNVASGQEVLTFAELPAKVNYLAFAPNGETLAAALHNGTIRLWDAPHVNSK